MSEQVKLIYKGKTPGFEQERVFTFQGEYCTESADGRHVGGGPKDGAGCRILMSVKHDYIMDEEGVRIVKEHCPEFAERIIQWLNGERPGNQAAFDYDYTTAPQRPKRSMWNGRGWEEISYREIEED